MKKYCLWCGEALIKGRRTPSEFAKLLTCKGTCQTSYRHHKKSKAEVDAVINVAKFCGNCDKLLVRKDGEHYQSWIKRTYCDKSCAAAGKVRKKAHIPKPKKTMLEASGCKQYIPGTPEFEKIAGLYNKKMTEV